MSDPWADPATPTQPGLPYTGPPPTTPQPWPPALPPYGGVHGHGGALGYGWPPGAPGTPPAWGRPPLAPRKPGQVTAAAVLAFVQAAVALVGTLYTYMLSSLVGLTADQAVQVGSPGLRTLASEGTVLAVLQLVAIVPLVGGGILALTRRSRAAWLTLVVALAAQVLIALYWMLRLSGAIGGGFDAASGPLAAFTLVFAAAPLAGLALVVAGPGRRWFTDPTR